MHFTITFDNNVSAQKALELVVKKLGGHVVFAGKTEVNGDSRIAMRFVVPEHSDFDSPSDQFCRRATAFLTSLNLNPDLTSI